MDRSCPGLLAYYLVWLLDGPCTATVVFLSVSFYSSVAFSDKTFLLPRTNRPFPTEKKKRKERGKEIEKKKNKISSLKGYNSTFFPSPPRMLHLQPGSSSLTIISREAFFVVLDSLSSSAIHPCCS
jgi:hypothetical protein